MSDSFIRFDTVGLLDSFLLSLSRTAMDSSFFAYVFSPLSWNLLEKLLPDSQLAISASINISAKALKNFDSNANQTIKTKVLPTYLTTDEATQYKIDKLLTC